MKASQMPLLILLLCSLSVLAQEQDRSKAKYGERTALKVEYFGELVLHPGLSLGLDYTMVRNSWVTLHWDTDLGGYWHRWNNTSVFLKTSFGSRFAVGPVFADINLGVGYMHSWAAGVMYQRTENGGVEKAANLGHPHFMPNASFLLGWDGSRRKALPWTIHIGPEVYLQYPYNHIFLPHVAAKIGFTYKLKQR
ncbi:hypothetical protein [Marinoscillum sp. 108]|uniref:hypothetical protein n=1 Tax=Marinoscillum sp. 108 TaxID=2653151 RepID=UPI0012F03455|nr:hypothetical protein [Marinoscillum sp. 108]VXD14319.1 conserved exported hypothetical protein [Marinoscillum sp. 108]